MVAANVVTAQAAHEDGTKVSAAADTFQIRKVWAGGALQPGDRGVDLERLGEVLGANGSDVVAVDAANEKGTEVSAAADTLSKSGRCGAGGAL